jgi:hypothetical protein
MGIGGRAQPKPAKGSAFKERKTRAKAVKAFEDAEKAKVRKRDVKCRWPHCENCRRWTPRLEVAHIVAKGMGGDKGQRSTADQMILLDHLTHQGAGGLEQHGLRIEPMDARRGTNGPCIFWRTDPHTGEEYMVARERAVGILERD